MIKLTRVDYRLIHGQVAMSWTHALDVDCILLASDAVAKDDMRKAALRLARPNGVKLVIKDVDAAIEALNSGVTDKYSLFIIAETIEDVYRLAKGCKDIKEINLGGTRKTPRDHASFDPCNLRDRERCRAYPRASGRWRGHRNPSGSQ